MSTVSLEDKKYFYKILFTTVSATDKMVIDI